MFRAFCLATLAALCISLSVTTTMAAPYQAGVARITVVDTAGQANAVIWYPTNVPGVSWQVGPFEIAASQGAPVAEGRFPVVLLSHGRQGGPLSHRDLAAHLAREGFIVVTPTHLGDAAGQPLATSQSQVLMGRPRQAIAALDATLEDQRFASHADPVRVGMIGYSAGGYTGLVLAGAKPDFALAAAYCKADGRNDAGSCGPARDTSAAVPEELKTWQAPSEPRMKALVLLDPLATMFDASGLAAVKMPVLLYRPQDDTYMKSGANALALAKNLPLSPQESTVPGRHFVFVDPCPEKTAAETALICRDEPGIDRAAIHRNLENEITDFLKGNL